MASYVIGNPWPYWVTDQTTSSIYIWPQWVTTSNAVSVTSVTGSYAVTQIWPTWVNGGTSSGSTWTLWNNNTALVNQPLRTVAAEINAVAAQTEQANASIRKERHAATVRARTLLDTVLDPTQRAELTRHGHFHVVGSSGRRYRICNEGQAGNVHLDDPRYRPARFCIHPRELVPDPDAWLAQLLALTTDEEGFLAAANLAGGEWPADCMRALSAA